jgi:hypothetical protein
LDINGVELKMLDNSRLLEESGREA